MELVSVPFAMRDLQEDRWLSARGIPRCNGLPFDQRITRPTAVAVGHFVVCWACSAVWRCKSSGQPDGGEGLVRCKGYRREAGSERSMDQMCESMDKNRIQGVSAGRAGNLQRSPYPSRVRSVD